jgi:hypothetical protein
MRTSQQGQNMASNKARTRLKRAVSSVGRAMPLQGMGHKFESCTAHHVDLVVLLIEVVLRTGSSAG